MEFIINLLIETALQVWTTFTHNWLFLIISVVIAVALKLYVNANKISALLMRYRKAGVIGATAAAVATPLCSCGTTAVILGMMASMVPWAPIIAFMVSSPLTSPEELIYSAGLFGWPFALAFFIASIVLGLLGGLVGEIFDRKGWLANQTKLVPTVARGGGSVDPAASRSNNFQENRTSTAWSARPNKINRPRSYQKTTNLLASVGPVSQTTMELSTCCALPVPSNLDSCGCHADGVQTTTSSCGCDAPKIENIEQYCSCEDNQEVITHPKVSWRQFWMEFLITGRRLLVMFLGFAFIGYFLNGLIPSAWVNAIFGDGNIYSVPLAATLGLPLYINSEASLPLVRALIDGGMSQGAAMAFLITGSGTSIGAFMGALTIARWRVIAIVVGTLWVGAVAMGYLYNFLLILGIF